MRTNLPRTTSALTRWCGAEVIMKQVTVVRKGTYQGVPQWGISTSNEMTPDKKTAEKWAQLEMINQRRVKPTGIRGQ